MSAPNSSKMLFKVAGVFAGFGVWFCFLLLFSFSLN